MKINEAPEKIYTDENENNTLLKRHCDSDIEYIRTDVFIEKAAEWLKSYVLNNDTIDIFEMEDEFKNYMKGE